MTSISVANAANGGNEGKKKRNDSGSQKDMKLPLSAIVLTYNEEGSIEDCLKSIYGQLESIFIVDSFSTDATLGIARRYTDQIYQHPFENYAAQRNWAQQNLPIRTEWVFHLDADERATPELMRVLRGIFLGGQVAADGFLVSRKTVFLGRWIRHGGHYPAYHLRIFKKNFGRCEERLYDQHFIVHGSTAILKGDIVDTITADIPLWKERLRKWAAMEAREVTGPGTGSRVYAAKEGNPIERKRWLREKYYAWPLFIRPYLYFMYRYFFMLGFLDGKEGFLFHFMQGFWFRLLVDQYIYATKKKGRKNSPFRESVLIDKEKA